MIYLDNAATSRFKPKKALLLQYRYTAYSANAGRGAHKAALKTAAEIEKVRERISEGLGKKRIIFTKNCTEALNLALFGIDLKGEVLVSPFEHNSVLRPLKKLENLGRISLRFLPTNNLKISSDLISDNLNKDTKLVVVSHISNVSGVVQDVEKTAELLKKKNILFLVDAAQSFGHIRFCPDKIDMLAASGHKGLHAPQGTGFLAVDENVALTPLLCGGTGTTTLDLNQPHIYPEGYESGTLNSAGIIALGAAYDWTEKHFDSINAHIKRLSLYLLKEMEKLPGIIIYTPQGTETGVVTFNLKKIKSTEVADILDKEYGIAVRAGLHCAPICHKLLGTVETGAVRASIGYNNKKGDIDRLLTAIIEIVRDRR